MEPISRRAALVGLTAVAVTGCAAAPPSLQQPNSTPSETPTPAPTPTEVIDTTPRWPLTGVPLTPGEESKAAHAAVAVKVPVEKRSFPLRGVDKADIVFVESQGKSYDVTRLCAVFHSKFPSEGVNPVRSTRPVDYLLLAPLKPVLACTGAIAWVLRYMKRRNKRIELREKYGDRSDRWKYEPRLGGWWSGGPNDDKSVVAMPKALSRDAKLSKGVTPPVYLPYAATDAEVSTTASASALPATQVNIPYKGSWSETHRWNWSETKGLFLASIQFPGSKMVKWVVRSGKRVTAPNVMVILSKWKMEAPKGNSHLEPVFELEKASGKFFYFHGGKYVTGTWSKGLPWELFEFKLDDGTPLKIATGPTWIEMPQYNAKVKVKPDTPAAVTPGTATAVPPTTPA